jgi:hypothetical protein
MTVAGTAAVIGAVTAAGRMQLGVVGSSAANPAACPRVAHVVAATSFAPVLRGLASELAKGDHCVRLDLAEADGRNAATVARDKDADVWIADDTAWKHLAPPGVLPPDGAHGSGTVVATSPIYMVTDATTASTLGLEGTTWLGLARVLQSRSDIRLVVRDPTGFGDGMVGAGALGEGVWAAHGMDASAVVMESIVPKVRTASAGLALPQRTGDVGVVPEYALLPALNAGQQRYSVLPGGDFVAELRYTFFPTAKAVADPRRAAVVDRLRAVLTGSVARRVLGDAGLRPPGSSEPPPAGRNLVPALSAPAMDVLGPHHIDHVFASWYRNDRRLNLTMVVDVSWSMSDPAPGSSGPVIDLVRRGTRTVGDMLPDVSRVGLWVFGSHLSGSRDYKVVLPIGPLNGQHRRTLATVVRQLQPEHTGTGLYDTILAAYTSARDTWTAGQSNQVMVFTDGINEDDPGSISLAQLTQGLKKAEDPRRPVQLSVVGFGEHAQLDALSKALEPIDGYLESLKTADQVQAMFIHLATGGLHTAAIK